MLGNFDFGNLRLIFINDLPLLVEDTSDIFPIQDIKEIRLLQGGPRSNIYMIGIKRLNGKISLPLYLDKDGQVSAACKEIFMCADNPFKTFELKMDFAVMGEERTALSYQGKWDTSRHKRLTFNTCAIKNLSIKSDSNKQLSLDIDIIAIFDPDNENDYELTAPVLDLMSRRCTLADCILTRDNNIVFIDTLSEFTMQFTNNISYFQIIS